MSSEIKVDTISEKTSANGVTIDGVLIKDGAIANSFISDFGLKEYDAWILTADLTGTNADITANWSRDTSALFEKIGTGMTESSGIFSFPSTGYYLVKLQAITEKTTSDQLVIVRAFSTTDNFVSQDEFIKARAGDSSGNTINQTGFGEGLIKVTDITTDKVKFNTFSFNAGTTLVSGINNSHFIFMKIGEI